MWVVAVALGCGRDAYILAIKLPHALRRQRRELFTFVNALSGMRFYAGGPRDLGVHKGRQT